MMEIDVNQRRTKKRDEKQCAVYERVSGWSCQESSGVCVSNKVFFCNPWQDLGDTCQWHQQHLLTESADSDTEITWNTCYCCSVLESKPLTYILCTLRTKLKHFHTINNGIGGMTCAAVVLPELWTPFSFIFRIESKCKQWGLWSSPGETEGRCTAKSDSSENKLQAAPAD